MRNLIILTVAVLIVAWVGFAAAYTAASRTGASSPGNGAAATVRVLKPARPAPRIAGLSHAAALPVALAVVRRAPTTTYVPPATQPAAPPPPKTTPTIIVQGGSK